MSIDWEAAARQWAIDGHGLLHEDWDSTATHGAFKDRIRDEVRTVIKAALGDTVLYEHDGEIRNDSIGLPLTPFDCVQNAIEWGMVKVWPESSE